MSEANVAPAVLWVRIGASITGITNRDGFEFSSASPWETFGWQGESVGKPPHELRFGALGNFESA